MIVVGYLLNDRPLPSATWNRLLGTLPPPLQARLLRYRRWEDRQAGLFGKLLLGCVSATVLGTAADLADLRTDAHQRPSFAGVPDFDFNISHTDGLVVCGGARGAGRMGIDVERRTPIALEEFRSVFTAKEYAFLKHSGKQLHDFYHLWTRKEAVMKADGRGFSLDPRGIDARGEAVEVEGKYYAVRALDLSGAHACHLAAGRIGEVCLRQYRIEEWSAAGGPT